MTDLITRARRAAGIAGNDTTGNLLIELADTIERQERDIEILIAASAENASLADKAEARAEKAELERDSLAARVIEADDEARQDYGGALMLLAALADELRPAKPTTGTVFSAIVNPVDHGEVLVSDLVLPGMNGPDLEARVAELERERDAALRRAANAEMRLAPIDRVTWLHQISPMPPDLAARLDRIEKWLTATHGYPGS